MTDTLATGDTHEQWPRPDWDTWQCMGEALLWECVALSCDISPTACMQGGMFVVTRFNPHTGLDELPYPDEFIRRLRLSVTNLKRGHLKGTDFIDDNALLTPIALTAFARFAATVRFALPDEFPRVEESEANGKRDFMASARRSHLVVIAALRERTRSSHEHGEATRIARKATQLGLPISDDTVRRILDAADALVSEPKHDAGT